MDLLRLLSATTIPDTVAFNAALVSISGSWPNAAQLLRHMCGRCVRRDMITGSMLISAFNSASRWPLSVQDLLWSRRQSSAALGSLPAEHWRLALHQQLEQKLATGDVATHSVLMKSFSEAGRWPLSLHIFGKMEASAVPCSSWRVHDCGMRSKRAPRGFGLSW